jgi:hypothetical protein
VQFEGSPVVVDELLHGDKGLADDGARTAVDSGQQTFPLVDRHGLEVLELGAVIGLAAFFGVAETVLDEKSVADPGAAVRVDVAAIKSADDPPDGMHCMGMVYDVNTGLVETY